MSLQMYERVESISLDRFLKKSSNKRDWYLYHTPPNELVCYFSAMYVPEILERFSEEAILACFKKLPANDLIHLCNHVSPKHMSYFLSPRLFSKKWIEIHPDIMLYEFKRDADLVFDLIKHKFITYDTLNQSFYNVSICELSKLYSVLGNMCVKDSKASFSRYTAFVRLFHPLLDDMFITFHYLPPELVTHVLSFLFVSP